MVHRGKKKKDTKKTSTKAKLNTTRCTGELIQQIFGITAQALWKWVQAGCPKNNNNTYDSCKVFRWHEKRITNRYKNVDTTKQDLEKLKLQKDIDLKQLQILKRKSAVIDIDKHQMILAARISSLRRYWEDTFIKNIYLFANKSMDALRPIAKEFVKQAMNSYINGSKTAET